MKAAVFAIIFFYPIEHFQLNCLHLPKTITWKTTTYRSEALQDQFYSLAQNLKLTWLVEEEWSLGIMIIQLSWENNTCQACCADYSPFADQLPPPPKGPHCPLLPYSMPRNAKDWVSSAPPAGWLPVGFSQWEALADNLMLEKKEVGVFLLTRCLLWCYYISGNISIFYSSSSHPFLIISAPGTLPLFLQPERYKVFLLTYWSLGDSPTLLFP